MSDDQPPSRSGPGVKKWWRRCRQAFQAKPRDLEEFTRLIRFGRNQGLYDREAHRMLQGVLDVSEKQVREVMIPRPHMVVLERDAEVDELLQVIVDSGHSRFPVIGEDRDEVLGILLAKDLLQYYGSDEAKDLTIKKLLRPATVIPESKRLNALLKEFRASHNHMAIVVDEYGGVAGLLTIEDVLEEIVGEIDDEHDHEEAEFIRPDGDRNGKPCFAVRALTRVEDFNEYFECQLDDEEYDTIGGLVLHELGRLPRRGEKVDFGGFVFAVIKADERRIDTLQVQRDRG
jgi:magnesium and cobalt transporter